jgi:integrase
MRPFQRPEGLFQLPAALVRTWSEAWFDSLSRCNRTSQPLKDIAQIILDTGLRPEEVFRIRIENLDFGERTIFNPFGKTKAARRKVTMTAEVLELLKRRAKNAKSPFVFPSKDGPDRPIGSVRKAHDAAVENAGIKDHFRLYDLRQHAESRIMPNLFQIHRLEGLGPFSRSA